MKKILLSLLFCVTMFAGITAQTGALTQAFRPITDTRPARLSSTPMSADRNRVMDFFQNQQFEEAISYLGPALTEDSASIPVLGYLGYAYYMTENNKAAKNCYQRIFTLDSANVSALYYLEILHAHEDPDIALDFAVRLTELQPGKSLWWRTKGELQRRLKQPDSALSTLTHAYELAREDVKNVAALADLLIERKEYRQADSIIGLKLEKDSLNFTLLKLRMRSAYSAKDYNAVLLPGERIMRLNLPDANAQSWLALSYYNLKRYQDCIRACEFLLNNGYDLEATYYYESRALSRLQRYDESDTMLAICLKKAISITGGWYYSDLGANHEAKKEFKSALAYYDTAYYIYHDPVMLYNCGRIAEAELKNIPLARKYYTRYLSAAHPDSPEEKKAYDYVKAYWGEKRKSAESRKPPIRK